jgi:hypothetical protein
MERKATMNANPVEPDLKKVQLWSAFLEMNRPDPLDREYGLEYYGRARKFLESYEFCASIKESYIAMLYPKIIGMYLFKIENRSTFGEWVWVVVGDIPPCVLPISAGRSPGMVLDAYLGEMDKWVEAVNEGNPVDDLFPVNAPRTKEYADMLLGRLEFIGERILMKDYNDDVE